MNCPSCDGIMNAHWCNACGWRITDQFPVHRIVQGARNPLKEGLTYPPVPESQQGLVNAKPLSRAEVAALPPDELTPSQSLDLIDSLLAEATFGATPEEKGAAAPEQPPAPETPIPDPVNKTVQ